MKSPLSTFVCTILFAGLVLSACATSASNLKVSALSPDKGAFFGRIQVYHKDRNSTDLCYVSMTDENKKRKVYTSLDRSGWIFSSATPGETYISSVICQPIAMFKSITGYETRDIKFRIPGNGQIAYFGNVKIQMEKDSAAPWYAMVVGGNVAAAVAGTEIDSQVVVQDKFDEASEEYEKRFGKDAGTLKVVSAVAVLANHDRLPASK